ncbi:hypothetical protein D3C71_1991210 [compost metagenome]
MLAQLGQCALLVEYPCKAATQQQATGIVVAQLAETIVVVPGRHIMPVFVGQLSHFQQRFRLPLVELQSFQQIRMRLVAALELQGGQAQVLVHA